jgi:hypothetical protein
MLHLTDLVSFSAIMQLPWSVWVPGLVLSTLFVLNGLRALLRLNPTRAFSRLVFAFVILVMLSQGGNAVAQLLGLDVEPPAKPTIPVPSLPQGAGG